MKRFIDIGSQMYLCGDKKEFSFYCTVLDTYENFNGENVWDSAKAFKEDYIESKGTELERYLTLIPDEFK